MASRKPKSTANRAVIVEELNRLMAEEIEAGLRYFQIRYRLKGVKRRAAVELFDKAMKETFEHAEAIAQRICSLGQIPKLSVKLVVGGEPVGWKEALAEVLEVEQQALDAYKDLLPAVTGDPVLGKFIRKQIAVETEHVREIATLLEADKK